MNERALLDLHSPAVEVALRGVLHGRELPLYRMMAYQLGWVDAEGRPLEAGPPPRVLGSLVLEVASAFRAPRGDGALHGAAVELLLNSCRIHEDVAEGNLEHRRRESVTGVWGPSQATNAGDGMHAVARLALLDLCDTDVAARDVAAGLEALDRAAAQFSEGAYGSGSERRASRGVEAYLRAVSRRDGVLTECAARLGAVAAGRAGAAGVANMAEYGSYVGSARRLRADLALFWGRDEGSPYEGVRSPARPSLPVEYALENAGPDVRRAIGDVCAKRTPAPADGRMLARMLEEAGSRAFAEAAAERLLNDAGAALERTELDPAAKERLRQLAGEIAEAPVV
ncbi:MAG: polyprenyl synthetase family protein [Gemmatimonadetes bacterium]|nr:polyprenyl synthetase family protein [Gemmatimonadota bacterium]